MVDWSITLRIIVFGVSIVFSVMGSLALIMWLMGVAYSRKERLGGLLAGSRALFRKEVPLTEEEIAAITGAIMAYLEEEAVTDHRRPQFPGSRWVLAGREGLMNAHVGGMLRRWSLSTISHWTVAGRETLMKGATIRR